MYKHSKEEGNNPVKRLEKPRQLREAVKMKLTTSVAKWEVPSLVGDAI